MCRLIYIIQLKNGIKQLNLNVISYYKLIGLKIDQ